MEVKEKENIIVTEDIIEETKEKIEKNNEFHIINDYETQTKSDVLTIFGILSFSFILILLIIFCTFTIINSKNDNIINGISIKGIDVSGLSKEEAKQKISEYINSSIPDEIKLKHNDFEVALSTSQLSIYFNTDEAIEIAYQFGKSGNIFQNNLTILQALLAKIDIDPGFSIDENQLKTSLHDISNKLPDKVIESSYYIDNNNLILTKGSEGYTIKIDETANYIINNINNLNIKNNTLEIITEKQYPSKIDLDSIYNQLYKKPVDAYYTQNPYTVYPSEEGLDLAISLDEAKNLLVNEQNEYSIPLKTLYPNITTNMIGTEAFPDLLSEFSTKYDARNRNRTTNLVLASNKINGTVLMLQYM